MLSKVKCLILYVLFVSCLQGLFTWFEMPACFLVGMVFSTVVFVFGSLHFGWLKLDDRDLLSQPLFLISILLPIYYSVAIGFWAWRGYGFEFSSAGFEVFLAISKLPLLLLASAIPLAAIVNNVHRTIQTEKQIRESERKNLFDAYYGHLKFMVEQFKAVEGHEIAFEFAHGQKMDQVASIKSQMSIRLPLELYRKSFHLSSPGTGADPQISEAFLKSLRGEWDKIIEGLSRLRDKSAMRREYVDLYVPEAVSVYAGIDLAHERICRLLCLGGYHSKYRFLLDDQTDVFQYGSTFCSAQHMYESLRSLEHVTLLVLEKMFGEGVRNYFDIDKPIFTVENELRDHWGSFFYAPRVQEYRRVSFVALRPSKHSVLSSVV